MAVDVIARYQVNVNRKNSCMTDQNTHMALHQARMLTSGKRQHASAPRLCMHCCRGCAGGR